MAKNEVAIVTGGSTGMGYAIALLLAQRGSSVVVGSRNPEKAASEIAALSGATVVPVAGDLAEAKTAQALIEAAVKLGPLGAVLLNHGGPPVKQLLRITEEEWSRYFDLMVQGPLRLLRLAVPEFRRNQGGRVLAITSFTVKSPYPGIGLSSSLRAALLNALKTAAIELGPENILLNAIAPGYVLTERTAEWNEEYAKREGKTSDDIAQDTLAAVPLRRYGTPQDIAEIAVFLLSASNRYLTGQQILVDGGLISAV
jgi:3-oxoacyl-[acyl-carrier protein] reductase